MSSPMCAGRRMTRLTPPGICEAVTRPPIRFVGVRALENQAALMHHKLRKCRWRTPRNCRFDDHARPDQDQKSDDLAVQYYRWSIPNGRFRQRPSAFPLPRGEVSHPMIYITLHPSYFSWLTSCAASLLCCSNSASPLWSKLLTWLLFIDGISVTSSTPVTNTWKARSF